MAQEVARNISGRRDALAHDLADCLWSVLVLANVYEIDIAREFLQTMCQLLPLMKSLFCRRLGVRGKEVCTRIIRDPTNLTSHLDTPGKPSGRPATVCRQCKRWFCLEVGVRPLGYCWTRPV
jgi:MazG nucleotide pyrophosphohydrolase domain